MCVILLMSFGYCPQLVSSDVGITAATLRIRNFVVSFIPVGHEKKPGGASFKSAAAFLPALVGV